MDQLRKGQQRVVSALLVDPKVNAQLPTGYGKTRAAMAAYKELRDRGDVSRCLFVVPTSAQLRQFRQDGLEDYRSVGGEPSHAVIEVSYFGTQAIVRSRRNEGEFYCCTIQALCAEGSTWQIVEQLMRDHQWFLVVDEYHHYGIEKAWGHKIASLPYVARLAMSATPHRGGKDSAFGSPDVGVSYRDAAEEKAVKPMRCHSYIYKIDFLIEETGEIKSFTTDDLAKLGDTGDDRDRELARRRMRWSPKYVSPLVDEPVARMERMRLSSGEPLQAIVYAMSCQHACLVYEQLREMHPHLRIDWVGTGENGRPADENQRVLDKFCPPKENGERPRHKIALDVLINVDMAGEGLDTRWVSEIIHLTPANISNQTNQKNGRGSRYLEGVECCINVDSTSEYAKYVGSQIMDVMDADVNDLPKPSKDSGKEEANLCDFDSLPEEPAVAIIDMECIKIDEGEVRRMAEAMHATGHTGMTQEEVMKATADPSHWFHEAAEQMYRQMRQREAEKYNDRSVVEQYDNSVKTALNHVTSVVIAVLRGRKQRFEKELAGRVKTRINGMKARDCGRIAKDVDILKKHYRWLKALETQIKTNGIPEWLRFE